MQFLNALFVPTERKLLGLIYIQYVRILIEKKKYLEPDLYDYTAIHINYNTRVSLAFYVDLFTHKATDAMCCILHSQVWLITQRLLVFQKNIKGTCRLS